MFICWHSSSQVQKIVFSSCTTVAWTFIVLHSVYRRNDLTSSAPYDEHSILFGRWISNILGDEDDNGGMEEDGEELFEHNMEK